MEAVPVVNTQQLRQIKIKTGVLKRSVKDHQSYTKEKLSQEEKLEQLRQDQNAEASMIAMREAELAETVAVIPGVLSNIQKAVDDLTNIIGTVEESLGGNEESLAALKETDEWKQSEEQIKLANEYLESLGE